MAPDQQEVGVVDGGRFHPDADLARVERDELRTAARRLGIGLELRYTDVSVDELWGRIEARNAAPPWNAQPILRSHLNEWAQIFQKPDVDEMALFDAPPDLTAKMGETI